MKRGIFALLLAVGILTGCGSRITPEVTEPDTPRSVTVSAEEQIDYEWMAGQSPMPNRRVGINRRLTEGTNSNTGVYFIKESQWTVGVTPPSPWIMYMDRGSDTVIKLCGRPDCPHDTTDCNAFVDNAQYLNFYNGYLYVLTCGPILTEDGREMYLESKLIRMAPDGTERVELCNFTEFVRGNGYDFAQCSFVDDHVNIGAMVHETDDSTPVTSDWVETYLYKLDGSMEEPQLSDFSKAPMYNYGDILIVMDQDYSYWSMDLDTGESTFLMKDPGVPLECFQDEAYYVLDGQVHRYTYATGTDEVVLKTELRGDYCLHCFPDCFIIAQNEVFSENPDMNLYIYNWNFEPVETVKLDYPFEKVFFVRNLIGAETPEQIILFDEGPNLPVCYIDKSELGTGNVQLHRIKAPDFENDQRVQEDNEDRQWLESN